MDNPVLWVLQAPSRSVGFPTENLMPWPGQVSDKSVSDTFSDFSSDVCDYNSIMANPSMYRPGPCLSSLLYSTLLSVSSLHLSWRSRSWSRECSLLLKHWRSVLCDSQRLCRPTMASEKTDHLQYTCG